MVGENEDLVDKFIEFEKTITIKTTVNDFFDYCEILIHERSDFVFAAILNQLREREEI